MVDFCIIVFFNQEYVNDRHGQAYYLFYSNLFLAGLQQSRGLAL